MPVTAPVTANPGFFGTLGTVFGNAWNKAWNGNGGDFNSIMSQIGDTIGNTWNRISGTAENNEFSAQEAQKARDFNSAEAAKQREWEEYMSNTAVQRSVEDMKKAGINPVMAAGTQASTPSGSAASAGAAYTHNSTGFGGFLGMLASMAATVIAKGVGAKMLSSASKAKTASGVVKNVSSTASSASAAVRKAAIQKQLKMSLDDFLNEAAKG